MYARDEAVIATPVGTIRLIAAGDMLVSLSIGGPSVLHAPSTPVLRQAAAELMDWFDGKRQAFKVALAAAPTERGAALRQAIVEIGYGRTISYGELAEQARSSARAVGQACARNPLPIIVPCHRVLAAAGRLGAYSAGAGVATKKWLLAHEQRHCTTEQGRLFG